MIQSYPLTLEGIPFRSHDVIGIYPLGDKVAVIHLAFGHAAQENYDKNKRTPNYVLLDTFSMDFHERRQAYLPYYEQGIFLGANAACYWENNAFLLNTKQYGEKGDRFLAKLIQISDTNLVEIGEPPPPVQAIYNDKRIYTFGEREVYMSSAFVMECRERSSQRNLWKLKLSAYLYTEVEKENDVLYFGTAGNGGRFYAVNAADGSIIFTYNTGGTERFTRYKEYILLSDRQDKPVLLSPQDGREIRKIAFGQFKFTAYQMMLVIKDSLYAIASGKDAMYAVRVDLSDEDLPLIPSALPPSPQPPR